MEEKTIDMENMKVYLGFSENLKPPVEGERYGCYRVEGIRDGSPIVCAIDTDPVVEVIQAPIYVATQLHFLLTKGGLYAIFIPRKLTLERNAERKNSMEKKRIHMENMKVYLGFSYNSSIPKEGERYGCIHVQGIRHGRPVRYGIDTEPVEEVVRVPVVIAQQLHFLMTKDSLYVLFMPYPAPKL